MHSQLVVSYSQNLLSTPLISSNDSYLFLMDVWDTSLINLQEQVYALFLNSNNEVICWRCVNTGNCGETIFDIKFILSCALGCMANGIIIAHNHPSGNLQPSANDVLVTNRLSNAAALMDIALLDHLITKKSGYYSLMDEK